MKSALIESLRRKKEKERQNESFSNVAVRSRATPGAANTDKSDLSSALVKKVADKQLEEARRLLEAATAELRLCREELAVRDDTIALLRSELARSQAHEQKYRCAKALEEQLEAQKSQTQKLRAENASLHKEVDSLKQSYQHLIEANRTITSRLKADAKKSPGSEEVGRVHQEQLLPHDREPSESARRSVTRGSRRARQACLAPG